MKIPYDWSKLVSDENVRTSYSIKVSNRFQVLQEEDNEKTANSFYENIMTSHNEAAEECVPHKEYPGKMKTLLRSAKSSSNVKNRNNIKTLLKTTKDLKQQRKIWTLLTWKNKKNTSSRK